MNKWMKDLTDFEDTLKDRNRRHKFVIRTPSPSLNTIFGNNHGLPLGYTAMLWGRPGAGKSIVTLSVIGHLHRTDPDAIVVKWDTEMRDDGQMGSDAELEKFGIDPSRYVVYQTNRPAQVFDRMAFDIGDLIRQGAPIRLFVVDSVTGVLGRTVAGAEKKLESESDEAKRKRGIDQRTFGDHAQTVQIGMAQTRELRRNLNVAMILTAHARAEMDQTEIMRGNVDRIAASFGVLHDAEYFIHVSRDRTAAGRKTMLGEDLTDTSVKDIVTDKATKSGHKIICHMQKNTVGPEDRRAEFLLDQRYGIVNQQEEFFLLGTRWGIITRPAPNSPMFTINGETFKGIKAGVEAMRDPKRQEWLMAKLIEKDAERRRKRDAGEDLPPDPGTMESSIEEIQAADAGAA